jgi:hypothetical protein
MTTINQLTQKREGLLIQVRHPLEYKFMKSIYYLHKLLEKEGYDYYYINVYNRKTGHYLGRQYFDKFLIDKPLY